jgi:hypothetical protein
VAPVAMVSPVVSVAMVNTRNVLFRCSNVAIKYCDLSTDLDTVGVQER